MVLDYRERKPVSKNRPKSKPIGMLLFAFTAVAFISFAMGIVVDRFLLPKPGPVGGGVTAPQPPVRQTPVAQSPAKAPESPDAQKQGNAPPPKEPSLTFYETLPKGGKVILGSGINPKIQGTEPPVRAGQPKVATEPPTATDPHPTGQKELKSGPSRPDTSQSPTSTQEKSGQQRQKLPADTDNESPGGGKVSGAKERFSVQVASARGREEAEAVKTSLQAKGFAAYVVESTVAGKGTWYRVRVGRHLDQTQAGNLANQIGKGAIVVPE